MFRNCRKVRKKRPFGKGSGVLSTFCASVGLFFEAEGLGNEAEQRREAVGPGVSLRRVKSFSRIIWAFCFCNVFFGCQFLEDVPVFYHFVFVRLVPSAKRWQIRGRFFVLIKDKRLC